MSNRSERDASKKNYAHGAIVRIKLESFVTYDSLEFSPGPNLNVIIGPNGTGKSSIVCAICLGMAGKPTVLGRAASLSDYIKYGKNKASVEIELNNPSGKNFIIKRIIYKDNKSEWYLNEKSAKLKEIEEVINSLNIQVGNLCQFLPQEKVSEFARLNTYELLENTEKAVGGLELYEKHMELKEHSKTSRDLDKELNNVEEQLKKEETINARLENQVESYNERQKHENNIVWLKRKRACLIYREKRDEYEKIKKKKDSILSDLEKINTENQPHEEKISDLTKKLQKQKNILATKTNAINESMKTARELRTRLDDCTEKINDIKQEHQTKETEIIQRKANINELKKITEQLKQQYEEAKENLPNINQEEKTLNETKVQLSAEFESLSTKEYEIKQEVARLSNEQKEITRKISEINNVRQDKLNKLRENSNHSYQAIEWLIKNKNQFKGEVYEPMFLLINVKHKDAAKYVENSIPFKDLCNLFLFENSDDMHLFMQEVRHNRKLIINAAAVPNNPINSFRPPKPINELKKFGFSSYLREIIEAPDAIIAYLCLYANIHSVPIGNENTQRDISSILPEISEFSRIYTSTHQYTFSRSRYTNKVSSSSAQVPDGFWLTSSINKSLLEQYENRDKEIKQKLKDYETSFKAINEEKREIEKKIENVKNDLLKLKEKRLYIDNMGKKYSIKFDNLKRLESEKINILADAKAKAKSILELSKKKVKAFNDYADSVKKLIALNKDKVYFVYQENQYLIEKRRLENELRANSTKKQELEMSLERNDSLVKNAKEEAKKYLQIAKEINETDLDKGLPRTHSEEFAKLPESIEKIDADIHQCEAIAQCAYDVDEKIVEEFKNRKKLIDKLSEDYNKKKTKLEKHQKDYEALKNDWLDKVEDMTKEINEKFSNLFLKLKCAGEISLSRPDVPDDFSKYGICIKVSFRLEEQLQELTAWQQSGGEKSVSTMMYMIALQEMTKCPFRVVDEINQGMDPINERKVFDIIVQNSCSKQFAQYFLLTPKLLPDLSFDEKTNVICVYNGPHNLPKYNLRNFIEIKKKLNQEKSH